MTEHVADPALDQFVQGELAGPALARFEAHVAGCEACAARLAQAARVELVVVELAAALAPPAGAPATSRASESPDRLAGIDHAPEVTAHPRAELALFVQGELAGPALAQLEAHVARCEACAIELAQEARVELAVLALGDAQEARVELAALALGDAQAARVELAARALGGAQAAHIETPRVRHARVVATIGLAAAAICCIVLGLVLGRGDRAPSTVAPGDAVSEVICAVRSEQAACVARAHRHGLFVQYPSWAGPPPLAGPRSSLGPSVSPLPFDDGEL